MSIEAMTSHLQAELPELLEQDAGFRLWLEDLIRSTALTEERFDARCDRMLEELAADRQAQAQHWEEQNRRWEEQNRKWDEQQRLNRELLAELRHARTRQDQGIGALGARWGLMPSRVFWRNPSASRC